MSCDRPMNQKEIIASISFLQKKPHTSSLVTIMNNIYVYPAFSNFCIICSHHSNEKLVMFLPNIYPGLLKVMKMTRKRNGSVPSDHSD